MPFSTHYSAKLNGDFSSVKALGVIRDCEEDGDRAFKLTINALQRLGLIPPTHREQRIHRSEKTAVGVLLLPDGQSQGCLEHSMLGSVDANSPQYTCVEQLLDCIPDHNEKTFSWQAKAKVRSLISTSDDPTYPMVTDSAHCSPAILKIFDENLLKMGGSNFYLFYIQNLGLILSAPLAASKGFDQLNGSIIRRCDRLMMGTGILKPSSGKV